MPPRRQLGISSTMILLLVPVVASRAGDRDEPSAPRPEVTLKGNVLCNRATDPRPWSWDPGDGDHTPLIYAVEGPPAIAERLRTIMEGYPERGLDVEDAWKIQGQFDEHLRYYISPGPMAEEFHKGVEAGSRLLALTGSIAEEGGRRWITVTRWFLQGSPFYQR